ncbi:MAG: alpha/beta fold hydrolase [Patescibacteria group bacterium]
MKFFKNKKSFIVILIFIFIGFLYWKTGFLQKNKIDEIDLKRWQYDEDGIIVGAKEFTLDGKNDTCWYLIHGYSSTPNEMRELANVVFSEFGETVVATRLKGSGEIPSHILNLSLVDWYEQISDEFDVLSKQCKKVNLVGFSFGGALSVRLAENKQVNNTYLLSPYLFSTYKYYMVLRPEIYLDMFADFLNYSKKTKIGQINSAEELKKHIAYWNMPFEPIKNSQSFLEEIKLNLNKIKSPVLLQHSENDMVSDVESSNYIYENISSEKKEIVIFEKSNHVISEDYDKEDVFNNIINFEKNTR